MVDQGADPDLYERVAEAFPGRLDRGPRRSTPETDELLKPYRDRITWDAPIHSVADIAALPVPAEDGEHQAVAVRGRSRRCAPRYDYCDEHGIGAYGGGQFELGPGRGQIQYLASLFHPDTPNDVAPSAYNDPDPKPGLPSSPLEPRGAEVGFRWET